MARRRGLVAQLQRAHALQVRAQQQAQTAQHRQQQAMRRAAEQASRAMARASIADERERKRLYLEARAAEVAADNADIQARLEALDGLLQATLSVDDYIDFELLKRQVQHAPFNPGPLGVSLRAPDWQPFAPPLPKRRPRHIPALAEAQERFFAAHAQHAAAEKERQRRLAAEHAAYLRQCQQDDAEAAAQNAEVERFAAAFAAGEPAAVREYFMMVLANSAYPTDFPQSYRLAFVPESRQVVVEFDLPTLDVIPTVKEHRYVKTRDEITASARPVKEIRERYSSVVAQVTLRTIHELFEADRGGLIETIVFNGVVDTVDPRTGQSIRPCLVTLRTTRDQFMAIQLANVQPGACLQHLNASVSKRPEELAPVRPVLEFDMVDPRFVDEVDVLADLDERPNLLRLTPTEFESLIQNLFTKMGLETKQTRPSRDGGVDCVAFDPRPIFGGKVVIQAKRYRNTVDVSAVRDLYGTLQNEGASKGILVTTSGYGQGSYDFAAGKPLELLDGSNLLFLLAEHADVRARIDPADI
jgi:restriction system protein